MVSQSTAIRAALKEAGYSSRKVSVKNDSYSMGSTVFVTIKDADIDFGAIEEIARKYENKKHNHYVEVDYSTEANLVLGNNDFYHCVTDEAFAEAAEEGKDSIRIGNVCFAKSQMDRLGLDFWFADDEDGLTRTVYYSSGKLALTSAAYIERVRRAYEAKRA